MPDFIRHPEDWIPGRARNDINRRVRNQSDENGQEDISLKLHQEVLGAETGTEGRDKAKLSF